MRYDLPKRIAALLLLMTLPVRSSADGAASPPQGAIYLGQSRMLEAAAPRQLSLNAYVSQFAYQPGGLEIAYVANERDGDQGTQAVKLAGVKHGKTVTLTTAAVSTNPTVPAKDGDTLSLNLAGWSADARFLLIRRDVTRFSPDQSNSDTRAEYDCVDVGADPIRSSSVPLPNLPVTKSALWFLSVYWWSPSRQRILFAAPGDIQEGGAYHKLDGYCVVYDPAARRTTPIPLPEGMMARGWLDESHVLADDDPTFHVTQASAKTHYVSYDLASGVSSAIHAPAKMPPSYEVYGGQDQSAHTPAASPTVSRLMLEDSQPLVQDPQRVATAAAHALWVRRPYGPKTMSAMLVGLTPGKEDPQAVWSPDRKQIAFVAHGDLFVTDLTERNAQPKEKYLAGEPLTCPEERELAMGSLQQFGLAILQFVQDNDEKWPTAQEQRDKLALYLPPDALLSIAGRPIVYHVPPGPALADMDAPADYVLGTIDLPYAQVALMADGHVKSFPKQGTGPDGANN